MLQLISRIRERIAQNAYTNEAAVSHGIVTPILNELGWDSADPQQLVPEYPLPGGRVDFALFGLGHRPAIFVEVKGIGRAAEGDRQLFEYAYHHGVPLCVLTDGREWSFYVPAGQGSYEDRRVYRLQLDDRDPQECERALIRYLARNRVRDGSAFEDAQRDYRDAAGRREAVAALPRAWAAVLAQPEDLLLDIVADKAEALCGFKPGSADVLKFLQRLKAADIESGGRASKSSQSPATTSGKAGTSAISFTIFGKQHSSDKATSALVQILSAIAEKDPAKLPVLAEAVRGPKRSLIASQRSDINPTRPDIARAYEFVPGWFVGLNISNQDKLSLIRTACEVFGLRIPGDVDILLPNAK